MEANGNSKATLGGNLELNCRQILAGSSNTDRASLFRELNASLNFHILPIYVNRTTPKPSLCNCAKTTKQIATTHHITHTPTHTHPSLGPAVPNETSLYFYFCLELLL